MANEVSETSFTHGDIFRFHAVCTGYDSIGFDFGIFGLNCSMFGEFNEHGSVRLFYMNMIMTSFTVLVYTVGTLATAVAAFLINFLIIIVFVLAFTVF